MIKAVIDFNNSWGDSNSNERLLKSVKGPEVQIANTENHLKDMAMRFERSPNPSTIKLWARDIINAGYSDLMIKEVCKSIPFKFERHPTLAQIMELLRPYSPQVGVLVDELDHYTNLCYPHLKAKFIRLGSQEVLDKMCAAYKKIVGERYKSTDHWVGDALEKAVLGDWLRSYFKADPQAIIAQGNVSNDEHDRHDREYFIRSLKLYAKEHKLG